MNKYIGGMNEIKADDELRRAIISSVRQASGNKHHPFFTRTRAIAVVVAVSVLCIAGWYGWSALEQDGGPQSAHRARALFDGFVLTAYAADGTPVEVKPDISFPLGHYGLTMSSVPGFPLKIAADQADSITLKATDGAFLLWTPPASRVIDKGRQLDIRPGDTVYWSPLSDTNDKPATESRLEIEAYRNHAKLGSRTVIVRSDDHYAYSGQLVE